MYVSTAFHAWSMRGQHSLGDGRGTDSSIKGAHTWHTLVASAESLETGASFASSEGVVES